MKVICIGTLDKFSRFFLKVSKEVNSNCKFYIHSLHFSGFFFSLIRFKFSSWISLKAWFLAKRNKKKYLKILNSCNSYKGISFKNLIKFHLNLNESISKQNLLLQALSYIDIIEQEILNKNPDVFLLVGDSKLCIETCIALSKKHNIKTYFIEQGPFNTTVLDLKGVNANASIRNLIIPEQQSKLNIDEKDILEFIHKKKTAKYARSPFYRAVDLVLDLLFSKTSIYPPDLISTDTYPGFLNFKKTKPEELKPINKNVKTYLLILQIPMDVNMVYHSPYFSNHADIVKKIHENLPNNAQLLLREHPLYKTKYEEELYDYCNKHDIAFDSNISLSKSFKLADVVVVNNSTVGIESIANRKPTIVLGNSYYDNPKLCIKYNGEDNFEQLLQNALHFKPNYNHINYFLQEFIFNYLVPGFISDRESNSAKIIAHKISSDYNNKKLK